MNEPLRILITNDDGIDAPGIWSLAEGWASVGEVMVVGPLREQSGAGTSFTYRTDMSIKEVEPRVPGMKAFALDGTPSDCVTVGLRRLATGRVSVVASGVNAGGNMGRGVLASGTLGGALQGHYRGLMSFAFSLERGENGHDWQTALQVVKRIAKLAVEGRLPSEPLLNVNIPGVPADKLAGYAFTRMALGHYQRLVEETDGDVVRRRLIVDPLAASEGTDVWAVLNGLVSITPFHYDLTHAEHLAGLQALAGTLFDVAETTG